MISSSSLTKALEGVTNLLKLTESVKALQSGQKELSDALRETNEQLKALQTELKLTRSEAARDAMKDTLATVSAVHGVLYEKLGDLNRRVSDLEAALAQATTRVSRKPRLPGPAA
jgi:peptidoglycan hydrolase CwlO-like protein